MPTIAVKVPEEFAARWQTLPETKRDLDSLLKLSDEMDEDDIPSPDAYPTTDEDLQAIGEALADADAGRVTDRETFFAEMRSWCASLGRK